MFPDRLINAREAFERGDKAQARVLLRDLILRDKRDEQAWLLLAQVVKKRHQTIDCLERVLLINPNNQSARRALSVLKRKLPVTKENQTDTLAIKSETQISSQEQVQTEPHRLLTKILTEIDISPYQRRPPVNLSLIIGGMIVLAIILIAILGPQLAPRDPLEATPLVKVGEKYLRTPYPILTPGFPLGSDGEGRDLLSRLLWAIRPTMILVLIVASVRLVLGTLIGLIAGWSTNWPGRFLDFAIAAAISIPVIIVALGGIAAVGVDLGIWAFIIALSLTGWVETARVVREQTQVLRNQVYIEAAHSLGGTNSQILRWHVLRQVLSLLWMLFAFEISSTLLLVAALGFLGYYIGGDIWVAVTDATAQAISGMPELGQLLATTPVNVTRPWPLIVIGAVVFLIVLGFNLLGEGLRRQSSLYGVRRRSALADWISRANLWADQNLWWPLSNLAQRRAIRYGSLALILLAVSGGLIIWGAQSALVGEGQQLASAFPQEQLWVSGRHDPYGTRWSQAVGPDVPQVSWTFTDETGFSGGVVVTGEGILYITSNGGLLYALDPDGDVIWRTSIPAVPVGTPAIGGAGHILITDEDGGLSALSPQGEIEWYFQPEKIAPATTGPIVAPDGTIYYAQGRKIRAVTKEGEDMWLVQPGGDTPAIELIQLSPEGNFLFWGEVVLDAQNGSILTWEDLPKKGRYFVGADGETYLMDGHEVVQWEMSPDGTQAVDTIAWDYEKYSIARTSKDAGVTPDGLAWLLYTGFARGWGFGEDTRLIWLDGHGNLKGNAYYPIRNSQVIAVDQNATIYTCGNLDYGYGLPECQAFSPASEEPTWKLLLEDSAQVVGGALVPGRLYVASQEGFLYAIGSGDPQVAGEDVPGDIKKENTPARKEAILEQAGEPLGPRTPVSREIFSDESGISVAPVLGVNGLLYVVSNSGALYALNSEGGIEWQGALPAGGVGSPALGFQGEVYAVDKEGGLSAYSSQGEMLWNFKVDAGQRGIAGPKVSPEGAIYYTTGTPGTGSIQAVSADGEPLWSVPVVTDLFYRSPDISADSQLIFFGKEVFDAQDGSLIDLGLPFQVDELFSGQDGKNYLLAEGTVASWEYDGSKAVVSEDRVLSPRSKPLYAGVSPEGVVWMLYSNESYWFTRDGQALGVSHIGGGRVDSIAGIDRDFTIYTCGRDIRRMSQARLTCLALSTQSNEPIWESVLADNSEELTAGLLTPGRIYISTEEGHLYLIEDSQ